MIRRTESILDGHRFRMLGVLPLFFFIARVIEYTRVGTPSQVLWMCHLANLLLAIGLLSGHVLSIRIAVLLVLFGIPPWAVDMWVIRIVTPVSVLSHLGGLAIALLAISKTRMRAGLWPLGLLVFLFVQLLCRLFTPPELNINTAHRVYEIWTNTVSAYWQYWAISTVVVAVNLWLIELALRMLFPPRFDGEASREDAKTRN
ncbi:MAG: hypothetical protein SF339_19200 [Blastocatellia bacterium]|nr:hypothetical protein [Blastocatellia bacterium]